MTNEDISTSESMKCVGPEREWAQNREADCSFEFGLYYTDDNGIRYFFCNTHHLQVIDIPVAEKHTYTYRNGDVVTTTVPSTEIVLGKS